VMNRTALARAVIAVCVTVVSLAPTVAQAHYVNPDSILAPYNGTWNKNNAAPPATTPRPTSAPVTGRPITMRRLEHVVTSESLPARGTATGPSFRTGVRARTRTSRVAGPTSSMSVIRRMAFAGS
jgi:hypothetical protein